MRIPFIGGNHDGEAIERDGAPPPEWYFAVPVPLSKLTTLYLDDASIVRPIERREVYRAEQFRAGERTRWVYLHEGSSAERMLDKIIDNY